MAGSKNTRLQEFFSVRFRRLLSGAPDGVPPWIEVIAAGDQPGLFTPDDAPWLVHAEFGTLVGGIRALLVQALHPATLAGVADHSRYKEDPLGRLAGTIRWLTVTTFGSREAIAREASRVNRLHERVKGEYESPRGAQGYRAADPNLLLWVHVAFMDSFLTCHQLYSAAPIPGGADAYISQWARSVEPLGLHNAPLNQTQLDATMAQFIESGQLVCNERTKEVVGFIRQPPLPPVASVVYRLLFAAAVVALRPEHRQLLGLKLPPRRLVIGMTRFTLRAIRLIIGPESPIEEAGRNRLIRIGAWTG
ncbi:MAG: oxygenase MpaB family protein [Micrococcales bacterium]